MRKGTHPGLRPPLRGEERHTSPLGRERGNVSSKQPSMRDTFPLCAAFAAGWVLPGRAAPMSGERRFLGVCITR